MSSCNVCHNRHHIFYIIMYETMKLPHTCKKNNGLIALRKTILCCSATQVIRNGNACGYYSVGGYLLFQRAAGFVFWKILLNLPQFLFINLIFFQQIQGRKGFKKLQKTISLGFQSVGSQIVLTNWFSKVVLTHQLSNIVLFQTLNFLSKKS